MKTTSLGLALLPLFASLFVFACGAPAPTGETEPEQVAAPKKEDAPPPPAAKTPPPSDAPPATQPPPGPSIATAKIHAGPVRHFAVGDDALWIATDTMVERTALDGTGAAPVPSLAAATALATDGTRVYALLDKGSLYELFSVKSDGTEGAHHSNWSWTNGDPTALTVNAGRVYFAASLPSRPADSKIVSATAAAPLGGGNVPFQLEEYVDAKTIAPVFTKDRLFAVDYFRQSAVRVSIADASASVDVIQDEVPMAAGGIATDGTDVYTRTSKGIVKVAIGSGANSEPIVVVPSATCSIFDPADGAESVLEDALVIDGGTIYTACRAGANVEVRAYDAMGKLVKTVAASPYNGGLTHLRITPTAAYWMAKSSPTSEASDLWRAAK
jgi:hypothetical protein